MKEAARRYNESAYGRKCPDSRVHLEGRNLSGVWMIGNNYKNKSRLYGAYPPGYVERIMTLFRNPKRILHLFSGSLPPGDYIRFDASEEKTGQNDSFQIRNS